MRVTFTLPALQTILKQAMALCLFTTTALATSATPSFAEGFALNEWSARGIALGGAVVARKGDPSSVAYNPALITQLNGTKLQIGLTSVAIDIAMSTTKNGNRETSHTKSNVWSIPNFYLTQQLSDRLFLGVGLFSRFGLGYEYDHDWPGRFNIYNLSIQSTSLNPNLALKVTDKLSLAAGVELLYARLDYNRRLQNPALPGVETDLDISGADDFGIGANLAAHYQFNDQWAVGLSYRSPVKIKPSGKNEFSIVDYGAFKNTPYQPLVDGSFKDSDAHATIVLPESIAGGLSWSPVPELSLEAGAIWTRWSRFKTLRIHLEEPMNTVAESKKLWKDSWRFNFGAEYQATDWLALRLGYAYDQSPMTDRYADYLVPTGGRHLMSAGVGLNFDDWTIDLAYAYTKVKNRPFRENNEMYYDVTKGRSDDIHAHMGAISIGYNF